MVTPQQYEITGLGLSGTEYTIEQTGQDKNFRPEYEVRDVTGDTIFRCTYNTYEGATPFVDDDDNELLTVAPSGTLDIAGDYLLTDSHTGDDLVVLDNDFFSSKTPGESAMLRTGSSSPKSHRVVDLLPQLESSCQWDNLSGTTSR